jgi:proteasome lid subunit RPN8/RPN11
LSMPAGLGFTEKHLKMIVDHLEYCLPEEGCGLVGGLGEVARLILPVENELHSPVRFLMRPMDQFRAMERLEKDGLELVAIFHSHPNGPDHPSATDVAEFYYPGSMVVIGSRVLAANASNAKIGLGLRICNWLVRGFRIEEKQVNEVKLTII